MYSKELNSLLLGRRSYRRFDESRKISDDVVADMQNACRLSSSAMNRQPLKFIYVRDPETVNAIFDITSWGGSLPDGLGRPKEGERPVMFVAVLKVKSLFSGYTDFDAGLAVSNMTLSAWSHGVGSCIIGSVNKPKLCEILSIGDDVEVSCAVGFGYPVHKSDIVDPRGDSLAYYLDDEHNYLVPKRRIEDTVDER